MKVLYKISKWSWLLMLVLYLLALLGGLFSTTNENAPDLVGTLAIGLVFGFMVQFVVGIIHVITAIVAYTTYTKLQDSDRLLLNGHAVLTVAFFITWWMIATYEIMGLKEESGIYMLAIFPTLIGGYFVYVAHRISKSLNPVNAQNTSDIIDS